MLSNRLLPLSFAHIFFFQRKQHFAGKPRPKCSSSSTVVLQSRVLGKLFGNRVSGSKKHWSSSPNTRDGSINSIYKTPSVLFQSSQFGKSQSLKFYNNTRRMLVLNKVFMTSITGLLATGKAAKFILGHNLQVVHVKITADFSCINVYWLGSGSVCNDMALEAQLQRCSGQLRHELSQLRLMGAVPRIQFVRDRTGSNINSIESALQALNLSCNAQQLLGKNATTLNIGQTARYEFNGNAPPLPKTIAAMPKMRQDVLRLDHSQIMDKIINRMRKSKEAWDRQYRQRSI